jgi:hypothetical protein
VVYRRNVTNFEALAFFTMSTLLEAAECLFKVEKNESEKKPGRGIS